MFEKDTYKYERLTGSFLRFELLQISRKPTGSFHRFFLFFFFYSLSVSGRSEKALFHRGISSFDNPGWSIGNEHRCFMEHQGSLPRDGDRHSTPGDHFMALIEFSLGIECLRGRVLASSRASRWNDNDSNGDPRRANGVRKNAGKSRIDSMYSSNLFATTTMIDISC